MPILRACSNCGTAFNPADRADRRCATCTAAHAAEPQRPRGQILRGCSRCGQPFDVKAAKWPHRFCPAHELTPDQRSPSTRAGKDPKYRQNRKIVLAGNPPCYLCGEPGADTVDHVIPVAEGGTNELDNLRPAHGWCNRQKGGQVSQGTYVPARPQPPRGGRLH